MITDFISKELKIFLDSINGNEYNCRILVDEWVYGEMKKSGILKVNGITVEKDNNLIKQKMKLICGDKVKYINLLGLRII
jgi:hypothetical protein